MTEPSPKSVMNNREADLTDRAVFDRFTEEARPPILRHIARRTGHQPHQAEDLAQDIFLHAWDVRAQFKNEASPYTWLHKIASNMILNDYRRSSRRLKTISLETPSPLRGDYWPETSLGQTIPAKGLPVDDGVIRNQFRDMVRSAVERLPDEYRAAVTLVDLDEVSYSQASTLLGVRPGTVKSRLSRGREKLAVLITPDLRAIPG